MITAGSSERQLGTSLPSREGDVDSCLRTLCDQRSHFARRSVADPCNVLVT